MLWSRGRSLPGVNDGSLPWSGAVRLLLPVEQLLLLHCVPLPQALRFLLMALLQLPPSPFISPGLRQRLVLPFLLVLKVLSLLFLAHTKLFLLLLVFLVQTWAAGV